jgi:histidyl-tRNA synthetase
MPQTQPARGMRDFLPEDVRRRHYVIDVVRRVYERYGFEPLETPALENIETLTGKYGDEGNKLIFKVLRRGEHEASGEADLALRYDLTVPLARVVAEHRGKLPRVFKRYQIQPVWRADRPARGRFREFYQCDVDAIGSTSPIVEVEMLSAVSDVLLGLGFDDFKIRINHRQLLTDVLLYAGIGHGDHTTALVALDKLDKIGADGVTRELLSRDIAPAAAQQFVAMMTHDMRLADVPAGRGAADELEEIFRLARGTSAERHLTFDPGLARGLSYYTGAIMEIAVSGIGSLGGGGRYDGLIGMFSSEAIPACGFSLGLERILVVMSERGMFPAEVNTSGPDVVLAFPDDTAAELVLRLATQLRAADLRVDVYPESTKQGKHLGKALKYASERKAAFVAIIEERELAANEVRLRNTTTREDVRMPQTELVQFLSAHAASSSSRPSGLAPRGPDSE